MHVTLAGQQQQSLRYCFNMITNSFKMTSGLEPESLRLSSQYPREVCTTFMMLLDIQNCEPVRFHEVQSSITKQCGKRHSDLLSHYKADGESFLSQIITGDETQTHHFELQTKSQWNGIIQLLLRISQVYPFCRESHGHCFTGCKREKGRTLVDIMPHSQSINSDLYVQTLKTLQKHFRRVRPHKMLLKISCNMTTYDHTSLKTQEAITNLKWTVLPHPPYSPDLAS